MDPHSLIETQFEKAVSIVQSLPKTGPIQTGYEEKLAMYSLYKQATVGNVKTPRPGMWDMLGRAKWDAWAKHKDIPPHEAKLLYVETLLKVLRKYSDKTIARDLVQELESYGDLAASFTRLSQTSRRRSASGSSGSESAAAATRHGRHLSRQAFAMNPSEDETTTDYDTHDDEDAAGENENDISEDDRDEPRPLPSHVDPPNFRPPSSLSSHMRYRTPMAGSIVTSPPPVPATQPLPAYTTPSAFAGDATPPTIPSSASGSTYIPNANYQSTYSYPPHLAHSSSAPTARESPRPPSRPLNLLPQRNSYPLNPGQPDPRTAVERAIENVQAHIAALTERVEMLESLSGRAANPNSSQTSTSLAPRSSRSFLDNSGTGRTWDPTQLGLWSLVIGPLTRMTESLREIAHFLIYVPSDEAHVRLNLNSRDPRNRIYARARNLSISSPVLLVIRRLMLDASFLLVVLGIARLAWRKTGLRRKNVYIALGVLWRALVGSEAAPREGRIMVEKGV